MIRKHGVEHWDPENCWGCKIKTVGVAPSAMPSRHPQAAGNVLREKDLVKDLDAFKGMRIDGLHPKSTRGAAKIASQAESRYEVESGQLAHEMAKGKDAGSDRVSQRGKEWRRRANAAHDAIQRGEVIDAS